MRSRLLDLVIWTFVAVSNEMIISNRKVVVITAMTLNEMNDHSGIGYSQDQIGYSQDQIFLQ